MKTIRSRVIAIAVLVLGSALLLVPRRVTEQVFDPDSGRMMDVVVRRVPIALGLDLRGGSHFALEVADGNAVDCADAIRRAARTVSPVRNAASPGVTVARRPR